METRANRNIIDTIAAKREGDQIVLTFENEIQAKDFFEEILTRFSNPKWTLQNAPTWSVKDIVQHYDIPAITVHSWVKKGRLTNIAVGRVLRFRQTQVEAVMAKYGRRKFSSRNHCR